MNSTRQTMIGGALILLLATLASHASAQSAYDGFTPQPNAIVTALAVQDDGRVLVGGGFDRIGGGLQSKLARLHGDGSLDSSFAPANVGGVDAIVIQPDGKVLAAGSMTNGIARFLPDGAVDPGFSAAVYGRVLAMALQDDGRVVIGGLFTSVGGQPRAHIARLLPDGSLDASFNPGASGTVSALAVQHDGKILVGGSFGTIAQGSHVRLARLHPDGSLDTAFVAEANAGGGVYAIAIAADRSIFIGGGFTQISGEPRAHIAHLSIDGAVDPLVDVAANDDVYALALEADGSVLLGGSFTAIDGVSVNYVGRIEKDGSASGFRFDDDFVPPLLGFDFARVNALAVQPDCKIVVGGRFPFVGLLGFTLNDLARLHPTYGRTEIGAINYSTPDDRVLTWHGREPWDGSVFIGGSFLSINGNPHPHLAALRADGTLDSTFGAVANGDVRAIASTSYNAVWIGGTFSLVNGVSRTALAIVGAGDGDLDPEFAPVLANGIDDPQVNSIVLSDPFNVGFAYVAGAFTSVDGNSRHNIARFTLLARELDPDFHLDINGPVYALAIDALGRVTIGGAFSEIDGQPRANLARLHPGGSLDASFNPGANGPVLAFAATPDGKLWVGGAFANIDNQPRAHLALLDAAGDDTGVAPNPDGVVHSIALYADGRVLVGGDFSAIGGATRHALARLTAAGEIDPGFRDMNPNGPVLAVGMQGDGKALVGGAFTEMDGLNGQAYLERLSEAEPALQSLSRVGRSLSWMRSGTAPALRLAYGGAIFQSGDGFDSMIPVDGGWASVIPVDLPVEEPIQLYAFGQAIRSGSGGLFQHLCEVYIADAIFADGFE